MPTSSTYYRRTANIRARDSKHFNHHRKRNLEYSLPSTSMPAGSLGGTDDQHGGSVLQTSTSYHGSTFSRKSRKIRFTETAPTASFGQAQHIRFNQESSDAEDMSSVSTDSTPKDKDNSNTKNLGRKQFPKNIPRTELDTLLSEATVSAETLSDDDGDDDPPEINHTVKQNKPNHQNGYLNTKDITALSSTLGYKRKASESVDSGADHSANEGPSSPAQKDTNNSVILSQATLEKIERRKQKKQRKKGKRAGSGSDGATIPTSYPSFKFNHDGFNGRIGMRDVRELVLWCLADGVNTSWMLVQNRQYLQKFVVLFVPGFDPSLFNLSYDAYRNQSQPINMIALKPSKPLALQNMPFFTTLFEKVVLTKGPGEKTRIFSPVMGFMQCPLSNAEKQRRTAERRDNAKKNPAHEPATYVLTLEEMIESNYPLPSSLSSTQLEQGWIETRPALEQIDNGKARRKKLIAMDCEMCKSLLGTELTRVTLVDENSTVIFDELVMPTEPIVDYVTQYSGMTEERLRGTTTSLQDVQRRLLDLIDHDTILVGHSLECDLKALKMAHPHIIDTARAFHHTRGPPYKPGLKWLANRWLNREIQSSISGHNSAEDALTCMDLLKLKLKHGPDFGHYHADTESLFVRLERHVPPRYGAVVDSRNGGAALYAQQARSVDMCENDHLAISKVLEVVQNHDFVWARLRELERFYGNVETATVSFSSETDSSRIPPVAKAALSSSPLVPISPQAMTTPEIADMLANLDAQVQKLYEGLPKGTALVVLSGVGDVRETHRLTAKQNKCKDLWQRLPQSQISKEDQWTEQDSKELETAVDRAKMGVGFFCVK